MTRDIILERLLPHPPETVWNALTRADLIARWLMPNDFVPVPGHRFTFRTQPKGAWDGVVHCEVLECDPPHRLAYSWKGGSCANQGYGAPLDTVVTWTLQPTATGTLLRLTHAGFRSPENDFAFDAMGHGWGGLIDKLAEILRGRS